MMRLRFLSILVCAAIGGCGSDPPPIGLPPLPTPAPLPTPPPLHVPPEWCPDRPDGIPVLATGDLIVRGPVLQHGAVSQGLVAILGATFESLVLTHRDTCARQLRTSMVDEARGAMAQLFGPVISPGADAGHPNDHGTLVTYTLPSTAPVVHRPRLAIPASHGLRATDNPSVLVSGEFEACDGGQSRYRLWRLDGATANTLWNVPCGDGVSLGFLGVVQGTDRMTWVETRGSHGSEARVLDMSVGGGQHRVLAEYADGLVPRDLRFSTDGSDALTVNVQFPPPGSGARPAVCFPEIAGFDRIALGETRAASRLNPPAADGFGIVQGFDGAGRYLPGDDSGAVWFEGDWGVDCFMDSQGRESSPLWHAAGAGAVTMLSLPADEFIHAFDTGRDSGTVVYLARAADGCRVVATDTAASGHEVLASALTCPAPLTGFVHLAHRATADSPEVVLYTDGDGRVRMQALSDGAIPRTLPDGARTTPSAVTPDSHWLYFTGEAGRLMRVHLASGEVEVAPYDGAVTEIHVIP